MRAVLERPDTEKPAAPPRLPRPAPALSDHVLAAAAAAVRGALKRTARAQQTLTWAELTEQLGTALPPMSEEDRRRLIVRVDEAAHPNEPLLSSVLAAADPQMAEAYRMSANTYGGQLPEDERELLREVISADVQQTHAYWRHR
jgi:uncharacterized membrane protein